MTNYDGLFNKEYFGNRLNENHFSNQKLHFKIIENGTIIPFKDVKGSGFFGGLMDDKGNFVKRTSVHAGVGEEVYTPNDEVMFSPSTVIYLGMFIHIWGHCLTDNLKRLWFLKSDIYRKYFRNCPVVYTPMWGVVENFSKLLKILEIDTSKLFAIDKPIKFANVIVPDESFFLGKSNLGGRADSIDGTADDFNGNDGGFFTNEYLETVNQIRNFADKNSSPLEQKKFYFIQGRNQFGEERIAQYFMSKGYAIVRPENLRLEDQLNIYLNCENWASMVGSISHNVIFLRDNSNVVLIPRRAAYVNIYQLALNQLHNLDVNYIDAAFSVFTHGHTGPYCYILSENLRKYFGDEVKEKYSEEDFITFLAYFRVAKSQGLVENPNEMEYLQNILPEFIAQLKTHENLMQKFGIVIK